MLSNTKPSISGSSLSSSCSSEDGGAYKDVRIAVVGQGGVGKSALIVRFITGRFLHTYNPTLEDKYHKHLRVDGENYRLCILDTAGEDDAHINYYFSFSHVLLLLFSLNDHTSLLKACQIRQKADSHWHGSKRIPSVLVGCKGDMMREVTTSEALSIAKELDCGYVETSAAEGYNCALPFKTAIKMYTHLYADRQELLDSGDHTHKHSRNLMHKCKVLLSPIKRELRDFSPIRLAARTPEPVSNVSTPRLAPSPLSGPTDSITITVSMEG